MFKYSKLLLLAAATLLLSACGGGGSGGGFLEDENGDSNPLTITTSSLPPVTESPYATVLEATGGTEPYTWTLVDDGETGLNLNENGVLRGDSPSRTGTYALTFRVTDRNNATAQVSLTLAVSAQPLAITTTGLPSGIDGVNYTAVLEAAGGADPYAWSLVDAGGTGLTVNSRGILSGVAPQAGNYGITLSITDDAGAKAERSFVFTSTGDTPQPLAFITTSIPAGIEGDQYAAVLAATGGTGSYSWQLIDAGGSGLTLRSTGILTGTVPSEGVYGLTIQLEDGNRTLIRSFTFSSSEDPQALTITSTSLPTGAVLSRYAAVLEASGGSGTYSWTLLESGGSGLTLSSRGVLRGTPSNAGTFGLSFSVNDGVSTATRSLTVTVTAFDAETGGALSIATQALPAASTTVYAAALTATGGTPPYAWSLVNDGGTRFTLTVDGALSGTTPPPGDYALTFRVSDAAGSNATRTLSLVVTGGPTPPVKIISFVDGPNPLTLPPATVGQNYSAVMLATGGSGEYTWEIVETVPSIPTLTIGDRTGVLSWPSAAVISGQYLVTIQVEDNNEPITSDVRTFTLLASDPESPPP